MIKNYTVAVLLLCGGFLFAGEALFAQNGAAQTAQPLAGHETPASLDEEIAMMRSDLRSNRKKAPDEAKWFWPTYDQYIKAPLLHAYAEKQILTQQVRLGILVMDSGCYSALDSLCPFQQMRESCRGSNDAASVSAAVSDCRYYEPLVREPRCT
jgi:hypothetical protein